MPKEPSTVIGPSLRGAITLPPGKAGIAPIEVAEALSISRVYVYNLMERGEFTTFHVGRSRRISTESVADFIERQVAAERATVRDEGTPGTESTSFPEQRGGPPFPRLESVVVTLRVALAEDHERARSAAKAAAK